MDDVLSNKVIRNIDPFRVNLVKGVHLRLGLVLDPGHVFGFKIVEHRYVIRIEDRNIAVQILTFEGIRHHSLILNTGNITKAIVF